MNVAYYPVQTALLGNEAFNPDNPSNQNGSLDRWIETRRHLRRHDIQLETVDLFDARDVDVWIVEEPTPRRIAAAVRRGARPSSMVLLMVEPPVVNPASWRFEPVLSLFSGAVLTWSSRLARKSGKHIQYTFPIRFDRDRCEALRRGLPEGRAKLCLMMHSNKTSRRRRQLYSHRRKLVRAFEARAPGGLDLYGHGWNDASARDPFFTDTHVGTTPDKWAAYARYKFSLCIDNCIEPGYITYDPLISMCVGTVPVYLPMPDATDLIPADTFVDATQFSSPESLVDHLVDLSDTPEYDAYRRRGWAFVNSDRFEPFKLERFARDVHRAVLRAAPPDAAPDATIAPTARRAQR